MTLERFSNIKEIQETDGVVRAITWKESDIDILQLDLKNVIPEERPIVEIHLYTIGAVSKYIAGGIIDDFEINRDKILINYGQACQSLGIERGQFEVVVNIYKNLLGSEDEPGLYIKEISDDRREVWIQAFPKTDLDIDSYLQAFGQGEYSEIVYEKTIDGEGNEIIVTDDEGAPVIQSSIDRPISDDIALNFGENQIFKILNQKDWNDENDFVVRLYKPLPDEYDVKKPLWTIEQLSDSYVDNIDLSGPGADPKKSRQLLGPNFDIDITKGTVTETDFRTWNDLLDANTSTSQQIVDKIFSGSFDTGIGVDYSGFHNFVWFSSAYERLSNFKYKMELVEHYQARITELTTATGTDATALQGNLATANKRKDQIIGSFDGFERWLYNEPTASIFTHHAPIYEDSNNTSGVYRADGGYLGSKTYRLQPWPKTLSDGQYSLWHSTSSIVTEWFDGSLASASFYDTENNNSLARTIPEHIRLDANNTEYELFVNMIGHHYDILYTHIENLTRIYKPEEHPKLGQSKDVLFQVAESLGWTLEHGNQATALWKYKLGVDSGSGAYSTTGSLFTKSNEDITTEVWRRIVNNLPYLLKTKGTARSIKALMNTYGIPQTLLSIREYGGPKVGEDVPTLIEDRFVYALQMSGSTQDNTISAGAHNVSGSQIRWREDFYNTDIGGWGMPRPGLTSSADIPVQCHEYRFRPAVKETMLLHTIVNHAGANDERNGVIVGIEYTSSYSGSADYGRVIYSHAGCADGPAAMSGSTDWVPLYNGQFWNLRHWCEPTSSTYDSLVDYNAENNTSVKYKIQVQMASDYIKGKVLHETSASYTPEHHDHDQYWSSASEVMEFNLGGRPAEVGGTKNLTNVSKHFRNILGAGLTSNSTQLPLPVMTFSGSLQEYRGWLEAISQETFNLHTLNPTSYVSTISPTSSFDTLVRHYPFGTDNNAIDHSTAPGLIITSSHPAQTLVDFSDATGSSGLDVVGNSSYATASNFATPLNLERGNYEPYEETYYIQGVSLGGNIPRSQKIRIEENELLRKLSPTNTSERSRFDKAPIDTNKLGLFYSAADQINKDIFNQIGDVALDDYVGDPDHEVEFNYPDLEYFTKEYWKKYSDKNDINAYMRIFSQFDFALFKQMKQLLPERVDEAMGLLIEPHALERAKVRLTKRPVQEPLHHRAVVAVSASYMSASMIPLSASIPMAEDIIKSKMIYHTGSGGYIDTGNYLAYLSGSNAGIPGGDPYDGTIYKYEGIKFIPYSEQTTLIANGHAVSFEVTTSQHPLTTSPTGSVILDSRISNIFRKVTFHYSTGSAVTKYGKNLNVSISQSLKLSYSQSLGDATYMDDFNAMTENQRYEGCRISSPGINIDSTVNALNQKPVVEIFETNPNTLVYNDQPNIPGTNIPGNLIVR
tara:strand:- start:303 stop:4505 length:4203 start_codon:yes stop_codon:yes gene_type:complete